MDSASPPLDVYSLSPNDLLTTEQVGALQGAPFGTTNTLNVARSVGRPGPRYLKLGTRVFYKATDLWAYLAERQAETDRVIRERSERYAQATRGARAIVDGPAGEAARDIAALPGVQRAAGLARKVAGSSVAELAQKARRRSAA